MQVKYKLAGIAALLLTLGLLTYGQNGMPQVSDSVRTVSVIKKDTASAPVILQRVKPARKQVLKKTVAVSQVAKAVCDTATTLPDNGFLPDTILAKGPDGELRIRFRNAVYDCVVVDLDKCNIAMHLRNKKGNKYNSIGNVLHDSVLAGLRVIMVTNAGMYTAATDPQGLFIEQGIKISPADTSTVGIADNFHLKPNGVFYMDSTGAHIDTTEAFIKNIKHRVYYATQSGPMLVVNNQLHHAFREFSKNLNIRSGVGVVNAGKAVFCISREPVNFYDFASLYKYYFKCHYALYLDGAISRMYLPALKSNDTGGNFGPIISVTKKK
ncbi:MAG: hypothetical protein RLZZ367_1203 [Bacteroidota bacterium]|jgi:uncharacterized protein YigE (DUF2233 family)